MPNPIAMPRQIPRNYIPNDYEAEAAQRKLEAQREDSRSIIYPTNSPDLQADNSGWDSDINSRLNSLAQALGLDLADFDQDQQEYGLDFQNRQRLTTEGMNNSLGRNSVRNADRGLSQSGIALQQDTDTRQGFDEQLGNQQQGYNNSLENVAKKRLAAEAEYNLKRLSLQSQLRGA